MIDLDKLSFHGTGLNRPECILAHDSGLLFAPCWHGKGGVSVVAPSGATSHILAETGDGIRPNGIALEPGGSFLLAHLGDERGAIIRLFPDGRTELVTDTAGGAPMPPANFVTIDAEGRIWITVSTRIIPRADDYRRSASTGFIARHEGGETKIIADGLGYTNEIAFAPDGKTLWVNETFARRTTRFELGQDGSLSHPSLAYAYGAGSFPDGLAPDAEGAMWVTSVISNRVIRIGASDVTVELEDSDPDHLAWVEAAYGSNALDRPHLDRAVSAKLKNISNIAFGGPDLRTAYLGCLLGDSIASFRSPVAGHALPHWRADLGPLDRYLESA